MKKILFVIPEYSYGGTNKSLQSLIGYLDKDKYQLYIYSLYEDGGEYYKNIFKPYSIKKGLIYYLLHDNIITRKLLGLYHIINKKDRLEWLYKYEAKRLNKKYEFDVIVSYQELLATEFSSYFENNHLIAWVQCDYPVLVGKKRHKRDLYIYEKYEKIICVSKSCAESLKLFFPTLSQKIISIYNTIDTNRIIELSQEPIENIFDDHIFSIISVGRFHKEKGFDRIPGIMRQVSEMTGHKVKWYLIGSGQEEDRIKNEIVKNDVEDSVVLMGHRDNPYPYIAKANLYVCTSDTESFSYTIAEAKILHTPIICNSFPVANEVIDKSVGIIFPIDNMAKNIVKFVNDKNGSYTKISKDIKDYTYDNDKIVKSIEYMFDKI